MFILVNDEYKYIILCFPKSGCSTVRLLHLKLLGGTDSDYDMHHIIQNYSYNQTKLNDLLLSDTGQYKNYYVTCIYRDVESRVCSAFFQKTQGIKSSKLTFGNKQNEEPFIRSITSFSDYLESMVPNSFFNDYHFQPQQTNFPLNKIHDFLHIRDISSIFKRYDSRLNKLASEYLKSIGYANEITKYTCNENLFTYNFVTDKNNYIQNNSVPSYNSLLCSESIGKIKNIYQNDIYYALQTLATPTFVDAFYTSGKEYNKESIKLDSFLNEYDFYFSSRRNNKLNILEIGVREGGGLYTLRKYFPNANIYGLDINPACKKHENLDADVRVFIGHQSDMKLLTDVTANVNFDVIIDDGSHNWLDQRVTFEFLFKKMNDNGLYCIENLVTSYNYMSTEYKNDKISFANYLKTLIDKVNWWCDYTNGFNPNKINTEAVKCDFLPYNDDERYLCDNINSISFSQSLCIIHKRKHVKSKVVSSKSIKE